MRVHVLAEVAGQPAGRAAAQRQSPVYDAALAATPADGDPQQPVGLGAFKYESYTPGNGNVFEAVRNPDYWRGPKGITGEQLPYLDEIDYVVAVDEDSRSNSVRAGDFDIMMTSMGDTIDQFLDDDKFEVNSSSKFGDTGYILLNLATGDPDPEGKNATSPLLNVDCRTGAGRGDRPGARQPGAQRRAVAAGQRSVPAGFRSATWRTPATRSSTSPTAQARDGQVPRRARDGPHRVRLQHDERPVQRGDQHADHLDVDTTPSATRCKATITPIEQGQYIGLPLTGTFQALGWRSHFGSDPDQQRVWWSSSARRRSASWR